MSRNIRKMKVGVLVLQTHSYQRQPRENARKAKFECTLKSPTPPSQQPTRESGRNSRMGARSGFWINNKTPTSCSLASACIVVLWCDVNEEWTWYYCKNSMLRIHPARPKETLRQRHVRAVQRRTTPSYLYPNIKHR